MTVKTFAPNYERNEQGFIIFPRDVELRRELFAPESMQHPAKMSLYLLKSIIEYLVEPGDVLADPMSGTGSLMWATELVPDVSVVLIEDVPLFHYIQTLNRQKLIARGVNDGKIILLMGPCQDYLPLTGTINHIIFSPPYANVMVPPGSKSYAEAEGKGFAKDRDTYNYEAYQGASKKNLGAMSTFFYNQEASKVYKLLFDSLKPGGTMSVVVQDKIKGGKREGLSNWVMRTCVRTGFELQDWFKRYSPGSGMKNLLRSKGVAVVDNEDVLILRKPV